MTPDAALTIHAGDARSSVLIHVPHAGLRIPTDVRVGIDLTTDELREEVLISADGGTAALARTAAYRAHPTPWIVENTLSRLVIDPERFLDGDPMEASGRGVVALATHDGRQLRDDIASERAALIQRFAVPYAAAVDQLVAERLAATTRCLIIDLHSYPAKRWPVERSADQARPQVCIGTSEQTPRPLIDLAIASFDGAGFDVALNTPYSGTYVPPAALSDDRVASIMIEVRKDVLLLDGRDRVRRDGMLRLVAALERLIALGPVATLIHAYGATTLTFEDPALVTGDDGPEGWVITACNPWSIDVGDAENAQRLDALDRAMLRRGVAPFAVTARLDAWAEPSRFVPAHLADRATILALGVEFEQNAVYELTAGRLRVVHCSTGEVMIESALRMHIADDTVSVSGDTQ